MTRAEQYSMWGGAVVVSDHALLFLFRTVSFTTFHDFLIDRYLTQHGKVVCFRFVKTLSKESDDDKGICLRVIVIIQSLFLRPKAFSMFSCRMRGHEAIMQTSVTKVKL